MRPERKFKFAAEDVEIRIPSQQVQIKVVKLPQEPMERLATTQGDFRPGRLVINFALVDERSPGKFLEDFESPFELRVRYTPADEKRAEKAGKPLELAFWDGNRWVRFTREKHNFKLQADPHPASGGYGIVQISKWGDPQIAWGP